MKKETFQFKELIIETQPDVYNPAEDTFQLLEAISVKKNDFVLEIGTGCGLIAIVCARNGANVVCTDINPIAVELARKNFKINKSLISGSFDVRLGDLFSPIGKNELFDIIIFNPPYLPTKKEEKVGGWFDVAVSGGKSGLYITKRFIEGLNNHLKKDGRAYFVFSSLSDRNKLCKYLTQAKLKSEVVSSSKYLDEQIDIFTAHI